MSGGFRLKNKKLLLTYPHTDYDPNVLIDKFISLVGGEFISYMIVARENMKMALFTITYTLNLRNRLNQEIRDALTWKEDTLISRKLNYILGKQ